MISLIVMDDVSGLADKSNTFANFLIVAKMFGNHCVYIFQIILLEKEIWKKLILQTKVFNILPSSIPYQTVVRLLESNVVKTKKKYLPARSLWINKLFIELASNNEKACLTIGCGGVDKNGPGMFRKEANSFAIYMDKITIKCLMFLRVLVNQQKNEKGIYFQSDRVRSKMKTHLKHVVTAKWHKQ